MFDEVLHLLSPDSFGYDLFVLVQNIYLRGALYIPFEPEVVLPVWIRYIYPVEMMLIDKIGPFFYFLNIHKRASISQQFLPNWTI